MHKYMANTKGKQYAFAYRGSRAGLLQLVYLYMEQEFWIN